MRTAATEAFPAIEWTRFEFIELSTWNCAGVSDDGRKFIGLWYQTDFEIQILNIEEA